MQEIIVITAEEKEDFETQVNEKLKEKYNIEKIDSGYKLFDSQEMGTMIKYESVPYFNAILSKNTPNKIKVE